MKAVSKQAYLYSIDNGNSHPHIAKFENHKIIEIQPFHHFDFSKITKYDKVIASCVGKKIELPKHINLIKIPKLNENSFLDMPVKYESSLGEDRLYQSYFLYHKQASSTLLIDAGTFTTFDFISKNGIEGGFIFLGMQTFLGAYQKGENLPSLIFKEKSSSLSTKLANNTQDAISNAASIYNIGILKEVLKESKPESIIITGGFSKYFENLLTKLEFIGNISKNKDLIHVSLEYIATQLKK